MALLFRRRTSARRISARSRGRSLSLLLLVVLLVVFLLILRRVGSGLRRGRGRVGSRLRAIDGGCRAGRWRCRRVADGSYRHIALEPGGSRGLRIRNVGWNALLG